MLTKIEMQTLEALRKAAVTYARQSEEKDWEQRRYEIAKDAATALLLDYWRDDGAVREIANRSVKLGNSDSGYGFIARQATHFADVLTETLKKQQP